MNAENRTVLGILRELTGGDDVFKVIEADEILAKLPEGAEAMTKQQLGVAIRELRDTEYVKVKYFTPDEYCLKTETKELPEEAPAVVVAEEESKALAEVQPENLPAVRERKKAQKESRTSGVTGKAVPLFFGMIGAMIGGGIVTAIALILQKVLFM